ncbi:hypothetical protein CsSME_00007232 [Camellia sinensis var. sinensis]
MQRKILSEIHGLKVLNSRINLGFHFVTGRTRTLRVEEEDDPVYADVPKPCRTKSERKPYPTPMKVLIRRAKEEREARKAQPCRMLEEPPDNGLLVPQLVELAHRVYRARESVLFGISKLVPVTLVQRCRYNAFC